MFNRKAVIFSVDILSLITQFLPDGQWLNFALSSKTIMRNLEARKYIKVTRVESSLVRWAILLGYVMNVQTSYVIAADGDLELLLWAYANECPWDEWTYNIAAKNGHVKILEWARENRHFFADNIGAYANEKARDWLQIETSQFEPYDSDLLGATYRGKPYIVSLLLKDGRANPVANNNWVIRTAVKENYSEITALLLKDGRADPRANENEAMHAAVTMEYTDILALLLQDGRADPRVAIHSAICKGNIEIVAMLRRDERISEAQFGRFFRERYNVTLL